MTGGVTCSRRWKEAEEAEEEKARAEYEKFEITDLPLKFGEITDLPQCEGMDFYAQGFKALSYYSPFDVAEGGIQNSVSSFGTVSLPRGLALLFDRNVDGKKRQRKVNSGSECKGSKRSESGNIWVETEDYFRELVVDDIERLHTLSSFRFCVSEKWFSIPKLIIGDSSGNSRFRELVVDDIDKVDTVSSFAVSDKCFSVPKLIMGDRKGDSIGDPKFRELVVDDIEKLDKLSSFGFRGSEMCFSDSKGDSIGNLEISNGVEVKEEMRVDEDVRDCMELDSVVEEDNVEVRGEENGDKDNEGGRVCCALSGVEWLLGSRSKIYLTSERPSKKRKLLGGDAGLEKLLVARPVEQSRSLCHYCSLGDIGDQLNRLIVCGSCGVAVHQRCYGVQEDVRDLWVCSWCKQKMRNDVTLNTERPCSLCPKKNGALKVVRKRDSGSENEGSLEFVHLFCCQWIPEVYVENTRTMEPIMNVDGVKDTRRKLICNICKDKCGACVRCSNGACRTSFHPICAREAMHRMEIWGKLGYDEVELRAFCSKHSESQNSSSSQHIETNLSTASNSLSLKNGLVRSSNNLPKMKIGLQNRELVEVSAEKAESELELSKRKDDVVHPKDLADSGVKIKFQNDAERSVIKDCLVNNFNEDVNATDSLNFTMMLKMLVERGKVDVKDVANDTGVPVDVLSSIVTDNRVFPDLHSKIVKWLKDHTYLGSLRKPLIVKIKSPKAETDAGHPSIISVVKSDIPHVVPVKSVPPRRRTNSSLRILPEDTVPSLSKEVSNNDGMEFDEFKGHFRNIEEPKFHNRALPSNEQEKILRDSVDAHDICVTDSFECADDPAKPTNGSSKIGQIEFCGMADQSSLANADIVKYERRFPGKDSLNLMIPESMAGSSVHPLVCKKLLEEYRVLIKGTSVDCGGGRHEEVPTPSTSFRSGTISDQCGHQSTSDMISLSHEEKLHQSCQTDLLGLPEFSPEDEVEGELIFYQHRLICNAVARKRFADHLISKVVESLPQEIDCARKQKWDAVSLNQYLFELREAKKQGRKERRHKEAQAVLAAATAAAAASSRSSSLRKDFVEDSAQQEDDGKVDAGNGKHGNSSLLIPRAKEALLRSDGARVSTEKTSDFFQLASDASRESSRVCDVCRRPETLLNSILVCSSCKVAVHLDCYRSIHNFTGPWYCELCEELSSAIGPGATTVNSWGKPYFVPECGLCGGTAGAFRKSTDGKWIHAFCAEWVLGSTFRRGQINPVEGMEIISKGRDRCIVCRRDHGVSLKCHYGHCQSTFHPSCGRSAGFYMNSRVIGGKLQNKAYCEKHSLEQRAKAENQRQHSVEEMKSLKQVRVELERLRLLCERIIKREKLKRELVICSQHILASKRDNIMLPTRSRHPMFQSEISSESVATSVKAFPESCKSGSEVVQRSDDVTVDSTVGGKRRIKFPVSMDNDQKTDDSSTSHHPPLQKPTAKLSFGGKQIPQRPSPEVSQRPSPPTKTTSDDRDKRMKLRMHAETFEKELVMTSDQASMKNQRLPKGYVYVPIKCLSKEKETPPDACLGEQMQTDGFSLQPIMS